METRANYVVVGIFTLVAVLAAFGFVYWTAGFADRGDTATMRFRIHGSASGLMRGSIVTFNGVKVGDITRVYLDESNPSVAIADAVVFRNTPITTPSTQADVGLAGLTTGQANIELRGGDPTEPNLLDLADDQGAIAEMLANPSAVSNLLESAQNIFRRADSVLVDLEGFASDARGPLTQTLRNVEQFSEALASNAEGVDAFLEAVTAMSSTLTNVSDQIESSLAAVGDLVTAVDSDKVAATVDNIERFTRRLDEASGGFGDIMARVEGVVTAIDGDKVAATIDSVEQFTRRLDEASGGFGDTMAGIEELVAAIDPGKVTATIDSIEQFTRRIDEASGGFGEIMDGVGTAVDSIAQFSATANETLARIDTIVGEVDAGALRTALTNFEQASVSVNAAANDVTKVTAAVGARADDIDRIISDAQQLAARLNQASERVDGVLEKVDAMLGSGEADGLMVEAGQTLQAFREVAETLNARMGTITDGLARFSNQGLRDVEALVRDGRRSMARIEQAITDLERNPQRILSGGAGEVRQFDGRNRR